MSLQGWQQQWYGSMNATSNTNVTIFPSVIGYSQPSLGSVLESPSKVLTDREWLDAQIGEVCDLAVAA